MIAKQTSRLTALLSLRVTPLTPFSVIWNNKHLLRRLVSQEVQSRYRGSLLGVVWSVLVPLSQLLVFTFIFTSVIPSRWGSNSGNVGEFSLNLFVGLIVYGLFSEALGRAPMLLLENPSYLKKVVFPVELLGVSALILALVNALISLVILLVFQFASTGAISVTVIALPLVIIPFVLLLCGLIWFLCATGVYVRDLRYAIGPILSLFMFLSPVFYPASSLPSEFAWIFALNPLVPAIEQVRAIVLYGQWPTMRSILEMWTIGLISIWLGYLWFSGTRRGFADVV
ncbi:ABC transporter permease [Bosea eneae]|uniref:Transport permease protein n=1 Tax=Bosea eneae TaxID=151454 RepID=A0ABW0IR92_9HYPH